MTDPIQTGNPPQQGQQWYTDDILGWEDIFAAIPRSKAMPEKDVIPYGELLDKKYQFTPLPEVEVPTVQTPVDSNPVIQEAPIAPKKIVPPVVPQVAPTPSKSAMVQPKSVATPTPIAKEVPTVKEPIVVPVSTVTAVVPPVEPIVTPKEPIESIVEDKLPDIEEISPLEQVQPEKIVDTKFQTDVQKKFGELFFTTKKIYELKDKLWITDETFDILWADNDKIFISYRFLLDETNEAMLFITKIEQDKETEEETLNELRFTFNEETSSLEVVINDTLLFDEVQDFTEDQKKKMQVVDKLNKFIFLASEELRKLEKEIKEKEEEEKERKKLQEIFRNF